MSLKIHVHCFMQQHRVTIFGDVSDIGRMNSMSSTWFDKPFIWIKHSKIFWVFSWFFECFIPVCSRMIDIVAFSCIFTSRHFTPWPLCSFSHSLAHCSIFNRGGICLYNGIGSYLLLICKRWDIAGDIMKHIPYPDGVKVYNVFTLIPATFWLAIWSLYWRYYGP